MSPETELKFAKRAIAQIAQMGGEHTRLLLEYIKLFSCKEAPLTLEQTYGILMEVDEFWKTYPAQAWQIAVEKLVEQQLSGSLKTPLKNHELLIDVMELIAHFDDDESDEGIHLSPTPTPPVVPPKSPDPPHTPRTEQQKAHAANHMQNMMATLNKSLHYLKVKP